MIPPSTSRHAVWKFGPAVLEEAFGRLSAGGQSTVLDHSTHGILLCLLRSSNQVVLKDSLLEAGWPGRVTSESSLTKAIHRLRQALGDTEGHLIRTVHGYGYQLAVEAVCCDESVGSTADDRKHATSGQPGRPAASGRRLAVIAALVMGSLAVAALASWDRISTAISRDANIPDPSSVSAQPPRETPKPSIAVLPFQDLSDAKDQEFLSDGLAEELINILSRVPQMRVAKRASSFSFRDKKLAVPELARQLDVESLLQGSVRRDGDKLHVSVQLLRGRDGSRIWSETYERKMDDILAVESEIATTVADRLRIKLLGAIPPPRAMSPRAYPLILEADALANKNTAVANAQAEALYEQALAISPNEAWAWSGLGRVYSNQAAYGQRPRAEGSRLAKIAMHRALSIDPDDAISYSVLGWIVSNLDNDPKSAAQYYEMALAKAPGNHSIISNVAVFLQTLGRMDEAIELAKYAVRRDPTSAITHGDLGVDYYFVGRWQDAIASSRTALKISPGYTGAHALVGTSMILGKGDAVIALEEMRAEPDAIYRLSGLAIAYHALGRQAESDAALAQLIRDHREDAPMLVAAVHAYRNDPDQAFEWLDKSITSNDPYLQYATVEPLYRSLHSDQRWHAFLRKIGKSPEQMAAISFKVKLPG